MSPEVFIWSLVVIVAGILSFFRFIVHRYTLWKRLNIPFIEPKFPYGNTEPGEIFRYKSFYDSFKGNSPLVGIFFILKPAIVLIDLNLIRTILIKDAHIFNDRGMYFNEKDDPLSANLVNLYGSRWKTVRSKMTPTFTTGKMKYMFATIVQVGQRFQKRLEELSELGDDFVIKDIVSVYTTDVIATCGFGIECDTLNNKNLDFKIYGDKVFHSPRHGMMGRLLMLTQRDWACRFGLKVLPDDIADFYTRIVDDVVDYRDKNQIKRNDFLDLMMRLRDTSNPEENITMNELRAQCFITFAAGYETSSTLLNLIFYELTENPEIQKHASRQVLEVLKRHNGEITYESLSEMKYLDCIMNETLRKYPPFISLTRSAEKDYKIPDTNFLIPKGTFVIMPVYAIHHDPEYYPEPEKFNPDRFSEEETAARHPMAFLPFGEGPRICIGMRFAIMEVKIALALALQKFAFYSSPKTESPLTFKPNAIVMTTTSEIYAKIKKN